MRIMARSRPTVARGGILSSSTVQYSRETQDLLKVMMNESRLTNFQQKQLRENIKRGQSLPPLPTAASVHKPVRSSKLPSHTLGIRTKNTIDRLERNRDDPVIPLPSKYNSAVEKDRLYNIMALGKEKEVLVTDVASDDMESDTEPIDRFEEVLQEIRERREFLEEMEHLGQRNTYESQLSTEISQKIRELELIDKERCHQELKF